MAKQVLRSCVIGVVLMSLSGTAWAGMPATTLTFDELPEQPANGLTVKGVTFAATDTTYHGAGPGEITWVQDPSLEGPATTSLTLTFDQPTTLLQFGVARGCICTLAVGASVELFAPGSGARSSIHTVATTPVISFSEGLFSYSGPAIQRAIVTFPAPDLAGRFSLDNLTFHRGSS